MSNLPRDKRSLRRLAGTSPWFLAKLLAFEPHLLSPWLQFSRSSQWKRQLSGIAANQAYVIESEQPTVLEEGLIYGVWKILYRNPHLILASDWKRYLATACSRVIILEVSPPEALRRIVSKVDGRGATNRQLEQSSLDGEAWLRARESYSVVKNEIERTRTRYVRTIIADSLTPAELCESVLAAVHDLQRH